MSAQFRGGRWHGLLLAIGLVFTLGSLTAAPGQAADANWPQWRGPLMTGVSPTADPPLTWSEKSHIEWKVKIPGHGLSTPLVWGDRVFIQTAIPVAKTDAAKTDAAKSDAAKSDAAKSDAGEKSGAAAKPDAAAPAAENERNRDVPRGGGRGGNQRADVDSGGMRSQPRLKNIGSSSCVSIAGRERPSGNGSPAKRCPMRGCNSTILMPRIRP